MKVLWLNDRFGIRSQYRAAWLQALQTAGINPTEVKNISLHEVINGQLLTRYKNRNAPTWIPERKELIVRAMKDLVERYKPEVLVLSSPESLAALNLDAEFATLHTLRGSTYTLFGIPAVVILPMSAWFTQVSQKDVAMANYGLDTADELAASASAAPIGDLIDDGDDESEDADTGETGLESEEDAFFYVPVMTPVGKMMINFDIGKVSRILRGNAGAAWYPNDKKFQSSFPFDLTQTVKKTIVRSESDIARAIAFLSTCFLLATDVETIPNMPKSKKKQPYVMTVVSYTGINSAGIVESFAFQLTIAKSAMTPEPENFDEILAAIRTINTSNVRKTLHNGIYDAAWFIRYQAPLVNYAYDSMTLFWSRYPDLPKTLDVVSSIMLDSHAYWKMGRKEEDFIQHTLYAMQDTETTLFATIRLLQWAAYYKPMLVNFHAAHRRCLIGLGMSLKGMPLDQQTFEAVGEQLKKESIERIAYLRWLVADEDLNVQSPAQMKHLLYGLLGAKPRSAKGREYKRITSATKISTGALAMKAMKADHPLIRIVVEAIDEAKKPTKQISNVMGLPFNGGRFYTSYDGIATTTTRYGSRRDAFGFGGNAQNIRKDYRKILRADADSFLLEVDFSAADDVFVSYESQDPRKIELVESGMDIHSYNAAEVFFTNWTYDQVVAGKKAKDPAVVHPITGIRQITKKTTHGANYLMAGMTLLMSAGREAIVAAAKHLGHADAGYWTTERLAEFCEKLDERYRRFYVRFARSGSNSFYMDLLAGLLRTGSFETIFGYTQHFSGDPKDQATLRAVAATVGQANTAGRVNMALDELVFGVRYKKFRDGDAPDYDGVALKVDEDSYGSSLRFQTHDSVTYNIRYTHPNWLEGVDRILRVMQRPVICKGRLINVGIEADIAINWAADVVEIKNAADCVPALERLLNPKSK
jgi:hypothetical protein